MSLPLTPSKKRGNPNGGTGFIFVFGLPLPLEGPGEALLLVPQYGITVLARTYRIGVDDVADKDTTIADFASVGYSQNNLYGGIEEYVTTHNGDGHALDDIRAILYTTIDAFLTALSDAVYVVVLKPVDVRGEQGCLDLFELGLSDNCFNLLHTFLPFVNTNVTVTISEFEGKITMIL
jgi:hypothetical protein